jgi:Hemerythrin HHE cation binding domain
MQTLPVVSHEHHDRLHAIVDQLNELGDCSNGDCLDTSRLIEARPTIEVIYQGLTTLLIPHMEAVEAAVYPTLERLLAGRETMAPMRQEHAEIRRLTGVIGHFVDHPEAHVNRGTVLLMRRALLRLYAILKAHLIEEELYLPILEDRLTAEEGVELAKALDHAAAATL